jgi:acyl carrier protein
MTGGIMDVRDAIRSYIRDEVMFGDGSIDDDTPLWGQGIIDSIGLMELVAFLEERFGIQIDDEELTAENFRTVRTIEDMVARRKEPA